MRSTDTLIDTGFLAALFNDGDRYHRSAVAVLKELAGARLYSVWEVLTEVGTIVTGSPVDRRPRP